MIRSVKRWLEHPRLDRFSLAAAMLLTLTSISNQLTFDDYVLGVGARAPHALAGLGAATAHGDLFTFTTGNPDTNRELMAQGVMLPWWTDPRHLNAFLRPLSSLTHRLDFSAWPDRPWLMHAHSWLWFGALLLVVRKLYHGVGPTAPAIASLAFLLFALDDVHGATLSWIANRNALVALSLSLPAVLLHHRATQTHSIWRYAPGPLCFSLGLLAGEAAIGALGYLAAHALVLERSAWSRRILGLAPYGVVLVVWRLACRALHLGSFGSDGYHDPIREPAAFALALAQNVPVLLGAQLSLPYADMVFWGPPENIPLFWGLSLLVLGAVLFWFSPLLRADPCARFYAVGALLAAVPVSASVPGQRLLLGVSVGAAGFLAHALHSLLSEADPESDQPARVTGPGGKRLSQWVLAATLVLHIPAAAFALPLNARSMTWVGELADHIEGDMADEAGPQARTWVVLNAPFSVMASYIQPKRALLNQPRPEHLYWLAAASSELTVTQLGPRTLLVEPKRGFLWSAQDRHYRRDPEGLGRGATVELPCMTAQVVASLADGRPAQVRFEFSVDLTDPSLALFAYEDGRYARWAPPGKGHQTRFSEENFFERLATQVVSGE